jgi:Tfp pilus assembly protein PilF
MGRRAAGHIRLVLLGLLPGLGCATGSGTAPPRPPGPVTAQLSTSARPPSPNLSPAAAADLCVTLGSKLESEGRDAEAIKQYELARHYRPKTDVAHRLAVLYDRVGDASAAMPEYARALKEYPQDADLLNDLGYHHYNLGRWDEAEKCLRQAVTLNPKLSCAWTNLGMTLVQEGRTKESLEAFRHCVSPAEAQCNLAFLLTTQGKKEEARAAYQEALRLQPGLQSARAALAKLEAPVPRPATVAEDNSARGSRPVSPAPLVTAATWGRAKQDGDSRKPAASAPTAQPPRANGGGDKSQTGAAVSDAAARVPAAEPGPGWVIPGATGRGAGNADAARTAVAATPDLPKSVSVTVPASPPSAAEPAGGGLRWVPPPPVPQPNLPAYLVPINRPPAAPGERGASAP